MRRSEPRGSARPRAESSSPPLPALALWSYARAPAAQRNAAAVVPDVGTAGARAGRAQRQPRRPARARRRRRTPRRSCARRATGLVLELDNVADGAHRVRVQAQPEPRLRRQRRRGLHDPRRHAPPVARARPARRPAGSPRASSAGASSRARRSRSATRGKRVVMHPRSGAFALDPKLPDGRTTVKLIASDRAGNRSVDHAHRRGRPHGAARAHRPRRRPCSARAHPTLRGSIDDASPVVAAGAARRRLGRAARARRQRAARRRRDSRAASRCRCSTSPRASTRSRSRRPTAPATRPRPARRPVHRRLDREAAPLDACSRSAPAAPTSCSSSAGSRPSAPTTGPFTRFYNARTAAAVSAFQRAPRPARHGHRDARRCCSSAPSASSCT